MMIYAIIKPHEDAVTSQVTCDLTQFKITLNYITYYYNNLPADTDLAYTPFHHCDALLSSVLPTKLSVLNHLR